MEVSLCTRLPSATALWKSCDSTGPATPAIANRSRIATGAVSWLIPLTQTAGCMIKSYSRWGIDLSFPTARQFYKSEYFNIDPTPKNVKPNSPSATYVYEISMHQCIDA